MGESVSQSEKKLFCHTESSKISRTTVPHAVEQLRTQSQIPSHPCQTGEVGSANQSDGRYGKGGRMVRTVLVTAL